MKSRQHSLLLFLLLIVSFNSAYAQGNISISGKVVVSEGQLPLQGVSISVYRKGIGTATNVSGLFSFNIPAANLGDTLKISCIGFKSQQLHIAGLKNSDVLNIALYKNTNELKEVSIEYHDGLKMIQKAIRLIPDNYINHPHVLRGFYRMYTFADQYPLQLSEAVFDVFNFGYADKHADVFRLIKARNEKNERDFGTMELGQKPNSVFEDDVVNHIFASGFLNEAGLEKHDFEVAGIVDVKGYEAYQINFKEKPGAALGTFRGKIFIDAKTYAFIYFDYGLSPASLTDLTFGKFAEHALIKMGNAQIDLKRDRAEVSYQEVGQKWVLAEVKGDNILSIKTDGDKPAMLTHVKFNYQVTAVDTTQTIPFTAKFGRNENINNYDSSGGEKFWKDYNILLSDFNSEEVFTRIRDINKAVQTKK